MSPSGRSRHHPVITLVPLDPSSDTPLHEQIYVALRSVIVDGRLATGSRIPSSRMLSEELRVSRNTVLTAYQQLASEGYLDSRVGGGTYVAPMLPDENLAAPPRRMARPGQRETMPISQRGGALAHANVDWAVTHRKSVPFRLGMPAVDAFPFDLWSRINARVLRRRSPQLFGYSEPAGYTRLRAAVASYVVSARGVRCDPDQIIIVEGAQVALDLATRVLLDPGDTAWIEDPGFPGARGVLEGNGATVVPVPVDGEGISVDAGAMRGLPPRLIYVTPSHQFPLGLAMSPSRRAQLLRYAADNNSWIVEDDYLSEFRYAGRPLQALQGMDDDGRVIYVGSFSKMLFPAIRLGYVVVPKALVPAFTSARAVSGLHASTPTQAVLAEFISEGHFVRHLRRMRNLYLERQKVLLKAAASELRGIMSFEPADAGMHLVGWLAPGIDDKAVAAVATAAGIETVPLSSCSIVPPRRGALLLSYTGVRPPLIWRGIRDLGLALDRYRTEDSMVDRAS